MVVGGKSPVGIQISTNRPENISLMGIPLHQIFELNMPDTQQPLLFPKPSSNHTQIKNKLGPHCPQTIPKADTKKCAQTVENSQFLLSNFVNGRKGAHFIRALQNAPHRKVFRN